MSTERNQHDPHDNRQHDRAGGLLSAALAAAARGWHVFPLRPGSKQPALHGAARCPRTGPCAGGHAGWEQRATTDPDRIRSAWATDGPAYNVGVACGPSRLVVIDLDTAASGEPAPREWAGLDDAGGAAVLAALADRASESVPATFTVATPSGGQHRYYRAPAAALRNTAGAAGLGWKIDTRAAGGYVVAAGSTTPAGAYTVTDDRPPVELPAWVVQLLRPAPPPTPPPAPVRTGRGRAARYLAAAIEAETARMHHAPAGQRNATLYVAAVALGQLVAGGALAEPDARAALRAAAARHLAVRAYSPRQAEQTITSGLRAGARRPRTIGDAA
jgi:hypothetical protein